MNQAVRQSLLLQQAVDNGLLHPEHAPIASFIDWETAEQNIQGLHRAFPSEIPVLHAFAVKANSIVPVLRRLHSYGLGAEVASDGELTAALEAGIPAEQIVFDSPAKSKAELRRALELGVSLNIDNFQELARVDELLIENASTSEIGIRLNPQVGVGAIAAMSTAGEHSKFGIPLNDEGARERLLDTYATRPWLRRVQAHIGSQGCPLALIADGIADLTAFADEVNRRAGTRQISTIDIGGGLPVDFDNDNPYSNFAEYVDLLKGRVPRLFSGDYKIVTEFGRSILAKQGFIAAYIEYTKVVSGRPIAISHAGAQVATRTVFMPEAWPLRVRAFNSHGFEKSSSVAEVQDIAGPCCFAGDLIARERELPRLEPGDIVALLDTGAYYASTPFQYNSLPLPGVYGVDNLSTSAQFGVLREAQALS